MVHGPLRFTPIGSYMPSVDARTTDGVRVLAGKNYYFDSLGPKSWFASKQLSPKPLGNPIDVQGITIEGRTYVFTQDAILVWRDKAPFDWEPIRYFRKSMPEAQRDPWSVIYINGKLYFSHRYRGLFSAEPESNTPKLWLTQENDTTILGVFSGIRKLAVVRNRAIIVTDTEIQWSNTDDFSDLTPELGGAGFQYIASFTKGTFIGLTTFDDGFVVWTTEGSVVAEYIGDDYTWRFYPGRSQERPISPWATVRVSSGEQVFLSAHGVFSATSGEAPEAVTTDFNEFLRDYIRNTSANLKLWRVQYDADEETIYLLESSDHVTYTRAFVLRATLNRWSEFNQEVYGLLPVTPDYYGYVDIHGVVNYLVDGTAREVTPPNDSLYDIKVPQLEYRQQIPSSCVITNSMSVDTIDHLESPDVIQPGWYEGASTIPATPTVEGLDSFIEIGYLRASELMAVADSEMELHNIAVSTPRSRPIFEEDFTVNHKDSGYFYPETVDWQVEIDRVYTSLTVDCNSYSDTTVDLMTYADFGTYVDSNDYFEPASTQVVGPEDSQEDWNDAGDAEDWNSTVANLNRLGINMLVHMSFDGITFEEVIPVRVRFDIEEQLFDCYSVGQLHRLRFEANTITETFHLAYGAITIGSGGQLL